MIRENMKQGDFKKVEDSLQKLIIWLKQNDHGGYDPYDIRGCSLYGSLLQSHGVFVDLSKKIIKYCDIFCPSLLRHILNIKKEKNAKAMGLFARSYLDLYSANHLPEYLTLAKESLKWLEQHSNQCYSGQCWGYPFDWHWLHFIPKTTPSGVVTSIVGDAFYRYYCLTGQKKYMNTCVSICHFFLNDLNIEYVSPDKICFSYTPIDRSHVLNANLLVAEFLMRIGKLIKNKEYIQYGLKALNYTLDEQNNDGSFYYHGKEDQKTYRLRPDSVLKIDHYHTGFVLRSLYSIYQMTINTRILSSITRCFHHYLKHLFYENTIPRFQPGHTYPVNIHSCAEAILCLSTLLNDFPEGRETLRNTTLWTIKEMQTNAGWFIYMIKRRMGMRWKIRIPYIRWGQAWMIRALTNIYLLSVKT